MNVFHAQSVSGTAVAVFLAVFPGAMMAQDDPVKYRIVINHEEQYSIWPADAKPEKGWKVVDGYPCVKYECLEYIEKFWTDMRLPSIERFVDRNLARAKEQGFRVD